MTEANWDVLQFCFHFKRRKNKLFPNKKTNRAKIKQSHKKQVSISRWSYGNCWFVIVIKHIVVSDMGALSMTIIVLLDADRNSHLQAHTQNTCPVVLFFNKFCLFFFPSDFYHRLETYFSLSHKNDALLPVSAPLGRVWLGIYVFTYPQSLRLQWPGRPPTVPESPTPVTRIDLVDPCFFTHTHFFSP